MEGRLALQTSSPMTQERVIVLAVGALEEVRNAGALYAESGKVSYVAFHQVTAELLDHLRPATVVSPVLATDFDCIDLAQLLNRFRFEGMYRAMTINLPKPRLVEAEIRQLCPRLNFSIVTSV